VNPGLRRLYAPRPVAVRADPGGIPREVNGMAVEAVREQWQVDDRWWIPQWLQREYFELALADGRAVVVFHCELTNGWFRQRA
jgi:hypothetical protein